MSMISTPGASGGGPRVFLVSLVTRDGRITWDAAAGAVPTCTAADGQQGAQRGCERFDHLAIASERRMGNPVARRQYSNKAHCY